MPSSRHTAHTVRRLQPAVDCGTIAAVLAAAAAVWCSPMLARGANRRHLLLDAARATISGSELEQHASVLAGDAFEGREAGSRGGRAAARYLESQMIEAGLQPAAGNGKFIQHFRGSMQNLIGKIPGVDPELASETILVAAHYDHVGYGTPRNSYGPWGFIHNGADDNASGVAALLEVMEALRAVDYQPRRTIVFALWDGEEKNLLGSKHWVRNPTVPLSSVRLGLNVDMVGRMVDGRLIVGGSRTGMGMRKLLSTRRMPGDVWIDFTWEYKENSDHWPLFLAGIPSLYVHTGLHDDYHRPSDDVERLNIDGIHKTSDYLAEAVTHAADVDQLPQYRPNARLDTQDRQKVQEAPLPPSNAPARLGLAWRADPAEPQTVFVTRVTPHSPAADAGMQVHDRIYQLDGQKVSDERGLLAEVRERLDAEAEQMTLVVERRGRIRDVAIRFKKPEPDPQL